MLRAGVAGSSCLDIGHRWKTPATTDGGVCAAPANSPWKTDQEHAHIFRRGERASYGLMVTSVTRRWTCSHVSGRAARAVLCGDEIRVLRADFDLPRDYCWLIAPHSFRYVVNRVLLCNEYIREKQNQPLASFRGMQVLPSVVHQRLSSLEAT